MLILLTFVIGVVSGLRAFTAPAAVSWGAVLLLFNLSGSWVSFMASQWTAWIFTAFALFELYNDKLPGTPSRKVPVQFSARILTGALSGATLGVPQHSWVTGTTVAVLGTLTGTFGGSWARRSMANVFRRDLPAALIEDVVGIGLAAIAICGAQLL